MAAVAVIAATAVLVLAAGVIRVATHRPNRTTPSRPSGTPVPLALASPEGVSLVGLTGDPIRVSTAPAALAFGVGSEFVVFHDRREGPVKVWSAGSVHDLPMGAGQPYVALLEASMANGVPYALVSEHTRGTVPSESFEEVVRIGLRDGSRRTILRRPAWESGYREARLLPDGDVVGLMYSLIYSSLVRLSPSPPGAARWETALGVDADFNLLMAEGTPSAVMFGFDRSRGRAPVITVVRHDAASGKAGVPVIVDVVDPGRTIGAELSCSDWLSPTELACGRDDGPPVAVSIVDGTLRTLPGDRGAMPTIVRGS